MTKVPAPLRFAEHLPASRTVRILLALAAPAYAALRTVQGSDLTTAILTTAVLVALVFVASTLRLTVGNHGISFDVSGFRRASSFGFVPLFAVRQAELGAAPQDWPRAVLKGGWWPGRQRVSVLYLDENAAPRAFRVWVSDPRAFGVAVQGAPLG